MRPRPGSLAGPAGGAWKPELGPARAPVPAPGKARLPAGRGVSAGSRGRPPARVTWSAELVPACGGRYFTSNEEHGETNLHIS